jgi:Skp family chaperone for outer membrane proteins
MKKKICLLVSLCVLISAAAAFGASAGGKIGFVDLQAIQAKSRWGDMIRQEVKKYRDKTQAEVEPKLKAIKDKGDEFEKKRAVLDEKARSKQQQELQTMQQEAQKLLQDAQGQMSKMQDQLIPPFSQKIREIASQIAHKDSYDLIVDKAVVLASGSDKDDLTTRVISELDKVTPATLPTASK